MLRILQSRLNLEENLKANQYTYIYKLPDGIEDMTLKDYLIYYHGYSSRLLRQIKKEGSILLDGHDAKLYSLVKSNCLLVVNFPKEKIDATGEDLPLEVIYEDYDILIINKQWGIVTHPTASHPSGNLANAIAWHWQHKNIQGKIRFVNRLDRDTSGIVVIAKNKYSHHFIQNEMVYNRVKKTYLAVVEGIPLNNEDTINLPIGRESENSILRSVIEEGQEAITHYKTIKKYKEFALLEINIETGRTHQIRVHMKCIGHPIVGDSLYNEGKSAIIDRQALHAKEISFIHPRNGKRIVFSSPIPADMMTLIDYIDNY